METGTIPLGLPDPSSHASCIPPFVLMRRVQAMPSLSLCPTRSPETPREPLAVARPTGHVVSRPRSIRLALSLPAEPASKRAPSSNHQGEAAASARLDEKGRSLTALTTPEPTMIPFTSPSRCSTVLSGRGTSGEWMDGGQDTLLTRHSRHPEGTDAAVRGLLEETAAAGIPVRALPYDCETPRLVQPPAPFTTCLLLPRLARQGKQAQEMCRALL
jgi:hypothetical protein